ncbi:MAG: SLC13 family permease, partial [Planctomycetota bacterium]
GQGASPPDSTIFSLPVGTILSVRPTKVRRFDVPLLPNGHAGRPPRLATRPAPRPPPNRRPPPLSLAPPLAQAPPPPELTPHGTLAIAVVAVIFVGLQVRRMPVEFLFSAGLVCVTLAGVIEPAHALAGFSTGAVILIGALFAAAAGLRTTGALDWLGAVLLGRAQNERGALWRLAAVVTPASAVVLNTPLVAMMAPVVMDWCRRRDVSPSRLLIPLSYLTILGGVCTVIGTSTTLVCNATLAEEAASGQHAAETLPLIREIGFLEIGRLGLPVAAAGVVYILLVAPRLLPNRTYSAKKASERRREYLVEMLIQPTCGLIGKTVEEAGLRHLPGLFLIEIDRAEQVITPVTPKDVLQADDRLVFTGIVETIADLERIPGLVPAADVSYESRPQERSRRQLSEAVLSRTSPLIGRTVREANFRQRYNAAIVAVHRNGERLTNKIGNIRLDPGDTLLLQTRGDFVAQHRNSRDFYLVSPVGGSSGRRHDRALIAGGLFTLLIAWLIAIAISAGAGWELPAMLGNLLSKQAQPIAAVAIVLAMIGARCLTTSQARGAIDLQVLITIAAAIGLGSALSESGAAAWIAHGLVGMVAGAGLPPEWLPYVLLAVVYAISMLLTETITNIAVASMMIPLAISVAAAADLNPRPFIMAIAVSASLSFATPIGYQTNLMVMGPGGYHPRDYLKVGLPLALLTGITAWALIPWIWQFDLPK